MINANVCSMDTDSATHLSQKVKMSLRRRSNKLGSATHKLTRCSHLLLLTALYTGTAITMGSNNQSGRLMTHDSSQSLLNTNISKVWSRDYACSAVVQQLHVQACLCGVSPKLGVGLSQGLDVPQQRVVILHLHSRFLQVLGYLLLNL